MSYKIGKYTYENKSVLKVNISSKKWQKWGFLKIDIFESNFFLDENDTSDDISELIRIYPFNTNKLDDTEDNNIVEDKSNYSCIIN